MQTDTPLDIAYLLSMHDAAITVMDDYWDTGEENERYIRVEHWDDDEKTAIENQGRIAYSIGLVSSKVNQILAYQRRNRVEYDVQASADPSDEIKAALAKIQYRELEQRCNLKYVDSDVFQSGAAVLYGAWEIYLDTDDDGNLIPAVRALDYKDVVFDPNAKTPERNDALFIAKRIGMYRYQLREIYGEDAADIAAGDDGLWGRQANTYYGIANEDRDFDWLIVFTHYQKVMRDYYNVIFNDYLNLNGLKNKKIVYTTKSRQEAEIKLRELKLPYIDRDLPLGEGRIEKEKKQKIDKYVFTVERILDYEETEMDDFPISLYFGYTYMDKFWTLTDVLKSAQQFIDRYIAQIDYSFGKDIKNAYELVLPKLAEGLNFEEALKRLEEDGVLPVKAEGAIKNVRSQGVNPQWVEMIGIMQKYVEDLSGGRSFQGLAESADESGRAIMAKQRMGELSASLLIDNFIRAKLDLGNKLLWWFKNYDTNERIVKIAGNSLTPEERQLLEQKGLVLRSINRGVNYLRLNPGDTSHLNNAKLELRISVDEVSETEREKKLLKLLSLAQINPQIIQLPEFQELILRYSDIEFSDRQKLLAAYEQMLQSQQQMAQQQQMSEAQDKQFEQQIEQAKLLLDANKQLGGNNGTKK